jgi:hypothetical protein
MRLECNIDHVKNAAESMIRIYDKDAIHQCEAMVRKVSQRGKDPGAWPAVFATNREIQAKGPP